MAKSPNAQQREVHQVVREQLTQAQAEFNALMQTELPAFNRMLEQRNVAQIIIK